VVNITNHQGKANQNHNEITLIPDRMAVVKKVSFGQDVKKRALLVRKLTGSPTLKNSVEFAPKIKNRIAI